MIPISPALRMRMAVSTCAYGYPDADQADGCLVLDFLILSYFFLYFALCFWKEIHLYNVGVNNY